MNIFYRPQYQSEITQFIDQLKAKTPGMEERQRQGRELLWDKTIDRDLASDLRAGQIEQKPYVYQTKGKE
jgi:hypothetical protein